ncbi:hypothetical protein YIM730264_22990 [Thermus hydrothermalis]
MCFCAQEALEGMEERLKREATALESGVADPEGSPANTPPNNGSYYRPGMPGDVLGKARKTMLS